MHKILDPKTEIQIFEQGEIVLFFLPQKAFNLIFLDYWEPLKIGTLGCSLPCLCLKTELTCTSSLSVPATMSRREGSDA